MSTLEFNSILPSGIPTQRQWKFISPQSSKLVGMPNIRVLGGKVDTKGFYRKGWIWTALPKEAYKPKTVPFSRSNTRKCYTNKFLATVAEQHWLTWQNGLVKATKLEPAKQHWSSVKRSQTARSFHLPWIPSEKQRNASVQEHTLQIPQRDQTLRITIIKLCISTDKSLDAPALTC